MRTVTADESGISGVDTTFLDLARDLLGASGDEGEPFDADNVAEEHGEEPPPDVARPSQRIFRLADLATMKTAAEDAVIAGGVMTRKGKVLVIAPSGAGKTTLLHHMAASLASGRAFLGRFRIDRPYRVLDVTAELTDAELASHGQNLLGVFEGTPAPENLVFWAETGLRLPRCYSDLREVVHDVRAEVVIFDPFMEFFEGESSDKPEQVGKVFAAIDRLQVDESLAGTAVAHHMRVDGTRSAGSWKFEGWPSTILELERVPGVPTDRMLRFRKLRAPGFGQPPDIQIRLSDAGYLPLVADEPSRTAGEIVVVTVLREAGGQLRRQDLIAHIQSRANVKSRAAIGYIGKAKQAGLIDDHPDGREVIYRVSENA